MGFMIRLALVLVLTLFARQQAQQPYGISYRLGMPRPASHLFEVTIDVSIPPTDQTAFIDFQIPKWQPGRYSVADFAANVQEFSARAQEGQLSWTKVDDQTWRVQRQGKPNVTATYRIFGNDLSGTYAQLDVGHASYTGGEIFMYVVGHKPDPVDLRIEPPPNWRVINGRTERPNQLEWKYPDYEIMIDNPTEIGPDWTLDEFKVDGKTYRVMIHSRGEEGGRRPAFVRDVEKIVRAEIRMWGTPEFNNYTFMFHFANDDHSSDGMEHLTSTQIIEPGVLAERSAYEGAIRTTAHEFFHAWNVKRLRPAELGPWDWTRPAVTRALWIAEGFTQCQLMSAEASSMAAPFIDAALHRQRTNLSNTSLSYYLKGELIALNLDLLIREKTRGRRSLDDVMRRAYDEFYLKSPNASYYLKGRGYSIEDFARVVSEIAGTDMNEFFARYIRGTELLPYDKAFQAVGLRLVKSPASLPYTGGIVIDQPNRQALRIDALRIDSPAERAGLQEGDVLVSIGGMPVTRENWRYVLNGFKQGDRVPITVQRFRKNLDLTIQLETPEVYNYRIEEEPDASAQERALRQAWLGGN
ncbi:MAG: hypothetical protein DMG12_22855 [Acidobacteria bacterium]|nr:MAG: hypothetical protein DMG12_22855 [Acidobacteriota bacterium]